MVTVTESQSRINSWPMGWALGGDKDSSELSPWCAAERLVCDFAEAEGRIALFLLRRRRCLWVRSTVAMLSSGGGPAWGKANRRHCFWHCLAVPTGCLVTINNILCTGSSSPLGQDGGWCDPRNTAAQPGTGAGRADFHSGMLLLSPAQAEPSAGTASPGCRAQSEHCSWGRLRHSPWHDMRQSTMETGGGHRGSGLGCWQQPGRPAVGVHSKWAFTGRVRRCVHVSDCESGQPGSGQSLHLLQMR